MGVGMLRGMRGQAVQPREDKHSPLMAGILLSLGNPYFLIWWATVGAALILRSFDYGVWGFVAFAVGHWLCDLIWDSFLSLLSFKGGQFFGNKFQQGIFAVSGVLLLFFGGQLVYKGVLSLLL
jgi:threonine/homoserine/homoserine lactone efflux protein